MTLEILHELSRIIHWGPLIALGIIKCITLTTLYTTSMWLPSTFGLIGFVNHLIYLILIGITLYNFFCATCIGPGVVPNNWTADWPPERKAKEYKLMQYCIECEEYKAPRAHHCRKCKRCIMKMDHHCPWINNCVGYKNHANFIYFLMTSVIGSIHSNILLFNTMYRAYYFTWYFHNDNPERLVYLTITSLILTVFSIGLSVGVVIAVGGLLFIQLKSVVRNQTGIEEWIVTKALNRQRDEDDTFVYPYDLGFWNNLKQVFFEPTNNGITWPVLDGCSQYTLTIEQLIQKEEKRIRACRYKIINNYNGSWFPLFSQGFRVCLSYPITDESRISLRINDIVLVTRWKKHWLYGKVINQQTATAINHKNEIKGWFPKKCAVEVVLPNDLRDFNDKRCFNSNDNRKKLK